MHQRSVLPPAALSERDSATAITNSAGIRIAKFECEVYITFNFFNVLLKQNELIIFFLSSLDSVILRLCSHWIAFLFFSILVLVLVSWLTRKFYSSIYFNVFKICVILTPFTDSYGVLCNLCLTGIEFKCPHLCNISRWNTTQMIMFSCKKFRKYV